jgi:hypothetical protein
MRFRHSNIPVKHLLNSLKNSELWIYYVKKKNLGMTPGRIRKKIQLGRNNECLGRNM